MAEEGQKAGPFAASSPPRRIAQRLGLVVLACGAVLALSAVLLSSTSPRTALVQEERGMAGDVEAQSAEEAKLPASLQLAAAPGAAGRARLQELSYADDLEFKQPYVPPTDLYIFWGKSSFKGHYAMGRVSSAQRVRKVDPPWAGDGRMRRDGMRVCCLPESDRSYGARC